MSTDQTLTGPDLTQGIDATSLRDGEKLLTVSPLLGGTGAQLAGVRVREARERGGVGHGRDGAVRVDRVGVPVE